MKSTRANSSVADLPLFQPRASLRAVGPTRPEAAVPLGLQERDITARRHRGNPESLAAQYRRQAKALEQRERVFKAIEAAGLDGLTTDELAARWEVGVNTLSGRFSELKAQRRIILCGRRPTRTGNSAGAYRTVSHV